MRKKRFILLSLLTSILALTLVLPVSGMGSGIKAAAAAANEPPLQLYLDGMKLNPAVPPRIVQDTTLVPARIITEALGAQIAWHQADRSVAISQGQSALVLTIGKKTAKVDGQDVPLDLAPVLENGSTMLPIRFVAENLGVLVRWDKPTRSVNLWTTTDSQVPGSDPATDPEVPEIPEAIDPALLQVMFVNNQLMIKTNASATSNVNTLTNPDRLMVELSGVQLGDSLPAPFDGELSTLPGLSSADPLVSRIQYTYEPGSKTVRIIADLKRPVEYQIANSGDRNRLIVHLSAVRAQPEQGSAVLIYHSHNRESFLSLLPGVTHPDSAFDPVKNVGYLGDRLAQRLQTGGTEVFHALDDYPAIYGRSFKTGQSYAYSEKTVRREMALHPQIRYVFDIHRDASSRASTTVKIGDTNYARLYFVIGLENPDWKENDVLAKKLQALIEAKYPGLSRGIYYKDYSVGNGWYNQNLSPRSALIEVGGVYNTLTESYRTIDILADAINELRLSGF